MVTKVPGKRLLRPAHGEGVELVERRPGFVAHRLRRREARREWHARLCSATTWERCMSRIGRRSSGRRPDMRPVM
jgi:hypothetical protein